jgi:hypothetical protein
MDPWQQGFLGVRDLVAVEIAPKKQIPETLHT